MTNCSRRILIALTVFLICGLVPAGSLKAWVSTPLGVYAFNIQPVDVRLVGYKKAKVYSGKFSIILGTPTLAGLPQLTTAPASVSLSHVTVKKGGSTVTKTRVNVPGFKIVQKVKWPANKSKVRIRLIFKRGSAERTYTIKRKPHP